MRYKPPKFSRIILLSLIFNTAIAPMVYAATDKAISRDTAYALGLLGLLVLALGIYLTMVIVQPEKF
jgi:K+-transporting ATPase KdpF subunit